MEDLYKNNTAFIKHLKKGEEKAYIHLVKIYHRQLFVYVLNLTNDHALAEDIVQISFLKIWEYRKNLNIDYSLKSFLYKITYNEFINQYRKTKALSVLESTYMETLHEVVEDENQELLERKIALVSKGIENLPPKCKEIFLLSKKEGLINIEIADYMNISVKTVEGHITKAYNLLRKEIGDQLNGVLFILFESRNVYN